MSVSKRSGTDTVEEITKNGLKKKWGEKNYEKRKNNKRKNKHSKQ